MASDRTITQCAIWPGLGIARVGSSPELYFIGPQAPGEVPKPPGGFKDADGRIKRQAARFRVYGMNAAGEVVKEITAADGDIEWRVHLVNRKANWYQFVNPIDLGPMAIPQPQRNNLLDGYQDRSNLVIDPGSRTITGCNTSGADYRFDTGKFHEVTVPLGELRTDDQGRLLVLGGHGEAASLPPFNSLGTFANNDNWYDDISDGPIRATVRIGEEVFEAEPAMVNVAPPNFAPGLYGILTMHDIAVDLFYRQGWMEQPPRPSFTRDIYPIFQRLSATQWASQGLYMLFGHGSPLDFMAPDVLGQLASKEAVDRPMRERLFKWFRDPESKAYAPAELPPFYGDALHDFDEKPNNELSMTITQYGWLKQWSAGDFDDDWNGAAKPRPLEDYPVQEQPMALAHAALEEILGGPFRPGIEATWIFRQPVLWKSPYRLNILEEGAKVDDDWGPVLFGETAVAADGPLAASGPGTLTRWMGVPWQADAASCLGGYDPSFYLPVPVQWAVRIPSQVLDEFGYRRMLDETQPLSQRLKHLSYRQFFLRDLNNSTAVDRLGDMVTEWDKLGLLVERPGPSDAEANGLPATLWIETGRNERFTEFDPSKTELLVAEGCVPPPSARGEAEPEGAELDALGNAETRTVEQHKRRRKYRRLDL